MNSLQGNLAMQLLVLGDENFSKTTRGMRPNHAKPQGIGIGPLVLGERPGSIRFDGIGQRKSPETGLQIDISQPIQQLGRHFFTERDQTFFDVAPVVFNVFVNQGIQ